MRPKSAVFSQRLRQEEMDGLTYFVLSGCSRELAFLKFIRPDFIGKKSSASLDAAVKEFFSSKDAKDYIDAYKLTLDEFLSPKSAAKPPVAEDIETRKALAKNKLTEFATELVEHIDSAKDPEFVLKVADKVGLLGEDTVQEEAPRRYLPVTCSECVYRKFVEENCVEE